MNDLFAARRTVAIVLIATCAAACKTTRTDRAELAAAEPPQTVIPSIGVEPMSIELGRGWKTRTAATTEKTCVQPAASSGLKLDDNETSEVQAEDNDRPRSLYANLATWIDRLNFRRPDDPRPKSKPIENPSRMNDDIDPEPQPKPESYFVPNEFVGFAEIEGETGTLVGEMPIGAETGLGLTAAPAALVSFKPEDCDETPTKNWRNQLATQLAEGGPKRAVSGARFKFTQASTLLQLSNSLDIDARAAVDAVAASVENTTQSRFSLNFERESVYQVIDATIVSDSQDQLPSYSWTTEGNAAMSGTGGGNGDGFYSLCGDAFVRSRRLGARYVQYFHLTRSSLQSHFSLTNTTKVSLKLGPFRASASMTVGWEFSENQQSQALSEMRYVGSPSQPATFPTKPSCMALFAVSLYNAVLVSGPTTGAPVSIQVAKYKDNLPGAGNAAGGFVNDGKVLAREFLTLIDRIGKYLGAVKDALENPSEYETPASRNDLVAKFKELSGRDYVKGISLTSPKPGGVLGDALANGPKRIELYEKNAIYDTQVKNDFAAWRAKIVPGILPRRFGYSYIIAPEPIGHAGAESFCQNMRDSTYTVETLRLLKEAYPQAVWRLPTYDEARALKHSFAEMIEGVTNGKKRVHLGDTAPSGKFKVVLDTDDGSGAAVFPTESDDGKSIALCIFAPIWVQTAGN